MVPTSKAMRERPGDSDSSEGEGLSMPLASLLCEMAHEWENFDSHCVEGFEQLAGWPGTQIVDYEDFQKVASTMMPNMDSKQLLRLYAECLDRSNSDWHCQVVSVAEAASDFGQNLTAPGVASTRSVAVELGKTKPKPPPARKLGNVCKNWDFGSPDASLQEQFFNFVTDGVGMWLTSHAHQTDGAMDGGEQALADSLEAVQKKVDQIRAAAGRSLLSGWFAVFKAAKKLSMPQEEGAGDWDSSSTSSD
mmetsp:Transcript_12175/g.29932  ORF Transcript_12175/g.29932 Transcript_12175/m.29932 type:complete len:249 (+) Transcript_12175:2-748(+)